MKRTEQYFGHSLHESSIQLLLLLKNVSSFSSSVWIRRKFKSSGSPEIDAHINNVLANLHCTWEWEIKHRMKYFFFNNEFSKLMNNAKLDMIVLQSRLKMATIIPWEIRNALRHEESKKNVKNRKLNSAEHQMEMKDFLLLIICH